MENIQISQKHTEQDIKLKDYWKTNEYRNRKFIFAFPGMGKTPTALNKPGYVDADFGYFRNAFKVDKNQERVLFKPYARMIKMWAKDGYQILSNQPDIMRYVPANDAVCFLPWDPEYSARKMKVSTDTIRTWVEGWHDIAMACSVPVVYVRHGLDIYLK